MLNSSPALDPLYEQSRGRDLLPCPSSLALGRSRAMAKYTVHSAPYLQSIAPPPDTHRTSGPSSAAMHYHTLPRTESSLLGPQSHLSTCKVGPHRRPLLKFAVLSRAATSDTYGGKQKQTADASRQAEQLSQLAKEVFEVALQSGPRGFTRSMQAANAFATIGRYNC